jgi:hypothetical protein
MDCKIYTISPEIMHANSRCVCLEKTPPSGENNKIIKNY